MTEYQKLMEDWAVVQSKYSTLFSGPNIGTEVNRGWWDPLLKAFDSFLVLLEQNPGLSLNIVQIKEKFGGLRLYYDLEVDDTSELAEQLESGAKSREDLFKLFRAVVVIAEDECAVRCEVCGEPGKLRHGGWMHTYCDVHEQQYKAQRNL